MPYTIPIVVWRSAPESVIGSTVHRSRALIAVMLIELASFGCCTMRDARYVYQDGQCGVVGIPEDTSRWPHYYRHQAERLMTEHFPDGFEIIRAEEVPEGSRTRTVGGSVTAELTPSLPSDLITVGKLGRTATCSPCSQADTLKIKECRIIYMKADLALARGAYAKQATFTPSLYVDPNEAERRNLTKPTPAEMKQVVPRRLRGDEVHRLDGNLG